MSDHYSLNEAQLARIRPYYPRSHGRPRVDDRCVISGIIHVIRNGLRWRDAPDMHGPHKTLYNRFVRWSPKGVSDRIFSGLAGYNEEPDIVMIDATHLKAHRTACSLAKKGAAPRRIGRTRGGLNSKLHALCDDKGRPIVLCLSEGQLSEHVGAKVICPVTPNAKGLIGDKGYDSDEFPDALQASKIKALHSAPIKPEFAKEILQDAVQAAPQNRKHVREFEGLAAHRDPIWPLCLGLGSKKSCNDQTKHSRNIIE